MWEIEVGIIGGGGVIFQLKNNFPQLFDLRRKFFQIFKKELFLNFLNISD